MIGPLGLAPFLVSLLPILGLPALVDDVDSLVHRLGNPRFRDRDQAARLLHIAGERALPALRRAGQADDPEIRNRAAAIAAEIQRRLDASKILAAQRVQLDLDDVPIGAAVRDFARVTGADVQIIPGGATTRNVTISTHSLSFWEALDQLCRAGGLAERLFPTGETQDVRFWSAAGPGAQLRPVIVTATTLPPGTPSSGRPIWLAGGNTPQLPTCYAGSFRIRALTPSGPVQPNKESEAAIVLQAAAEPRISWHGLTEVRIDEAVDEHGQVLRQLAKQDNEGAGGQRARRVNGVVVFDVTMARQLQSPHEILIRLEKAEKPAAQLRALSGALSARVESETETLVEVEDVLQKVNKTIKGFGGDSIRVLHTEELPDGGIKIVFQLQRLRDTGTTLTRRGMMRNAQFRAAGQFGGRGTTANGPGQNNCFLWDSKGARVKLVTSSLDFVQTPAGVALKIESLYQPDENQSGPYRLTYADRRLLLIEIPFTLRDVPLR